ncbi:MAG: hypothetical protein WA673_19865 [Candidatus Acidiferrales bacterium]
MASLDNLEGEAIEGVILVILLLIGLTVFGLWKVFDKNALANWLRKLWLGMDSLFAKGIGTLSSNPGGDTMGGGPDVVYTGINAGSSDFSQSAPDGSSLNDYQPAAN